MWTWTRRNLVWVCLITLLAACGTYPEPAPPKPTASPTAEPTATSIPPESPLAVSALVTYRGDTAYTGMPPIEVTYGSATWRFVDDPLEPTLVHNTLDNCTLMLRDGARGAEYAGELDLGSRRWIIAGCRPTNPDVLVYHTLLGGYSAIFRVTLPPENIPGERSQCLDAVEQVLATFATTDSTAHADNVFDLADAVFFAVDDPSNWPTVDGGSVVVRIPPGWNLEERDANPVASSAWQMRGVLPGSLDDHFQVIMGVNLFTFENQEQLTATDWVDQQPPSEMQLDLVERSDEAVGEYPAVYEKRIFPWTGGLYFHAWLDCGGKIWRFSTGGHEANAALDAEMEGIFRAIVAGFRCTAEE